MQMKLSTYLMIQAYLFKSPKTYKSKIVKANCFER